MIIARRGSSPVPYKTVNIEYDGSHKWAVIDAKCDLCSDDDNVVLDTVDLLRDSYGESDILSDAQSLCDDDSIGMTFNNEHLKAAIRRSLPDPAAEGNKPPHLANYRAEPAELVARRSIQHAFGVSYPTCPQKGKTNPNQPILGFDGWGIIKNEEDAHALVLLQVKATDEAKSPPSQASVLVTECRSASVDTDKLCRALTVMALALSGTDWQPILLKMLERLGEGLLPHLRVAPAIVRGICTGCIEDLRPCRDAVSEFSPAIAMGTVTHLGVDLSDFGKRVAEIARAAS